MPRRAPAGFLLSWTMSSRKQRTVQAAGAPHRAAGGGRAPQRGAPRGPPGAGTQRCPAPPAESRGEPREERKREGERRGGEAGGAGSGGVPGTGKGQAHPCPSQRREQPGCGAAGGEWPGASCSDMPRYIYIFFYFPVVALPRVVRCQVRAAGLAVALFQLWGYSGSRGEGAGVFLAPTGDVGGTCCITQRSKL